MQNGAGQKINTVSFDASSATKVQALGVSVTTLAAGDYLVLAATGTFSASVGNITVFVA